MRVITVVNLKGGSGKTTSTAYLAHAYAAQGRRVLVIDADPQGSALRWSESAEWDIPTLALPVKTLHSRLRGIVSPETDVVLIDTPPLDEQAGIVYSAMRAADAIVVTMAPTMIEFERLPDVWAAIEEIGPLRPDDDQPAAAVLLNRTVSNARSTPTYREAIQQSGHLALETSIPRREQFAQAFGAPITQLGAYEAAAAEIDGLGAHHA